jgi:cytochrome c oxidase accessory protein FixG
MSEDNTPKVKIKNKFELDPERLATTDEKGNRVYLYPEDVEGVWKNRRHTFYWILIIVYLVLPWIYIKDRPSIQLDIFHREFTLFGYTWHGVEPILIFLTLTSIIFFIGFMTSIFGRVWCGWGCPQTVFIQGIFLKIEKIVEGSARVRRERDQEAMSFDKLIRKLIKWSIFFIISSHIAHTFIGYIWGPRELFKMTLEGPMNNPGVFTAVSIFTAILLFDFGWFREQFCIIACPYGRMQSVLMDANSLVVAYDKNRGEPHRGSSELINGKSEGDCINCYNCVKACPTGIDIRRGTQLECIACTNCIDACDEIMDKMHKPRGLVKYSTENELKGKSHKRVSYRSVLYILLSLSFLTALIVFISNSGKLNFQFYRGQELPYQIIENAKDGKSINNHFTMKVTHQGDKAHIVEFRISDEILRSKVDIITVMHPLKFDKNEMKTPIFFKFSPSILLNRKHDLKLEVIENGNVINIVSVPLVGP